MTGAFLELLRTTRRGRFKVILGMSAGVGKTVAMLREAKRLARQGLDVVAGIIETHGRAETAAEIEGVVCIERRRVVHRGVTLEEMDVEALVARAPELALVDELAHTNVPGSEREKRWQDVEALLAAGINVMGTLNVQHLESLHDIVLRETGVDVRERVPDKFLRSADEVVVIDLAPEDLQDRLRQGKVYQGDKIERALSGFFQENNLAALRQLALREVANNVEQRERLKPRRAITRPSDLATETPRDSQGVADAERVMVCMSSQPSATRRLLRHGARLAGGLNTKWFVVYVRTPGETPERIDSVSLRSLSENVRLARELGAEVVRLESDDVEEALVAFANEQRVSHAIFGRTRISTFRQWLFGTITDRFLRRARKVDVVIVGDPVDE